jgi:hypothetical protein
MLRRRYVSYRVPPYDRHSYRQNGNMPWLQAPHVRHIAAMPGIRRFRFSRFEESCLTVAHREVNNHAASCILYRRPRYHQSSYLDPREDLQ